MNPIYDCPLSVKAEDMASLLKKYERPALLLDVNNTVLALTQSLRSTGVTEGMSVGELFTAEELCAIGALQVGDLISLQLSRDTTLYAEIGRFDGYFFINFSLYPLPAADEEETYFNKGAAYVEDVAEEQPLTISGAAKTRRQDETEKDENQENYRLNRKALVAYIADESVHDEDSGYFDPSKAAELVTHTLSVEFDRHGAKLFHKIAPAEYLSDADQEGYCSALGLLAAVAAKNADNGVVRLEGASQGKLYTVSVSFGHYELCARLEEGTELSEEELAEHLGEDAVELLKPCPDYSWWVDFESVKGGKVCLKIKLPLTDRKAYVFLRPLITKAAYKAVVKRITAINWA